MLKHLIFGGTGRDEEEAERMQNMRCVSFTSHKKPAGPRAEDRDTDFVR